jgi:hypothetical protein
MEGSMKKLFVLFLCLVAVAGVVSANTLHPPGAPASEVLPGYGVDYCAVTPDTVLVVDMLNKFPDQILAVSDLIVTGLPQIIFTVSIAEPELSDVPIEAVDYPLRL